MAALALGGSMLGATVQVVLEKFASHAIREVGSFLGFNEYLGKMKDSLEMIKAYLIEAESKTEFEENRVIKVWIDKARRANYKADDFLDELQYHWLQRDEVGDALLDKLQYSHRVQEINEILIGILATSAVNYNLIKMTAVVRGNLEVADEVRPERVTTSLMGDEKVIGRDDKKTEVIEQLMSEHEGVQVLTIYGIGGVGKTTLARYVYNDEYIQNHFELKSWVCVSDNFNVKMLTSEILDSVMIQSKKSNTRPSSEYMSLDELQKALREELAGKKFLFVLDDVWNKEQQKWDEFKKPFVTAGGISKSKILVTTRPGKVVKMMSPMKEQIELEGLSRDNFWNLFKRYAFDGSNSGSNQEIIQKIGKEIVKKLKGSPLAAKTVGRLLKSDMSEEHWNDILNSEMWKLSEEKDDIMPALRLSYQHLPGALKPCFAFLSLFPKDYQYRERMLKELWIANGFIFPQGTKPLEDIATTYINTLLSMCMIQGANCSYGPSRPYFPERIFVMHDLLHDLAQIISREEYFYLRDDEDLENISDNVRHLNISPEITSSKLNNFKSTFKNLRTLVWDSSNGSSSCFNNKGLHRICIEAKHLRALVMSCMRIAEPLSLCQLKHLRYLDLSLTDISCLPESLCTFYNLQVLNVKQCGQLKKFPVGIIKLVNLHHLYTFGAAVSTSSIKNVGKLTSLRELCFHVSKEAGHRVTELENMNYIRGLKIEYLENVSSKEEAIRARLNDKKHIVSLTLKWSLGIIDGIPYDEILCGLQPYKYLKILKICNYGGTELPPWEENENGSLPTLQDFVLKRCLNLHILKSLEHPELKYLEISDCPKLKKISICKAPMLQSFMMSSCKELSSLGSDFESLDSLVELKISNCPALWDEVVKKNWVLPSSLKSLKIKLLPNPSSFTHEDELVVLLSKSFEKLVSLSCFHLSGCKKISVLDSILPPSLQQFTISDCEMIESIPDFGLLPSLRSLSFDGCSNLKSLPENLNHLTSLQSLHVWDCPKIMSLPANGLPPSLRWLIIFCCPLLKESCQKDVGSDWPKISNIPNVRIDGEVIING